MQQTLHEAHLPLQARTKVINNELEGIFRCWYPRFRLKATSRPRLLAAPFSFSTVEFVHGVEHGNNIFNRSCRLHIMDGVKNEATARGKYLTSA